MHRTKTRAEKVAQAQKLRRQGLSVGEIARAMGVARSTASAWLADPDLAKQRARREGYAGRCIDCGAPTNGSNGHGPCPQRCLGCSWKQVGPRQREAFRAQRELVERLWAEGKPTGEIADVMGWTGTYRHAGIAILRSRGYNLPHRRSPEVVAKLRAAARARAARKAAA